MFRATLAVLLASSLFAMNLRAEDWEDRMYRQMHKKVTLELVDTPLSEACTLLTSICGLNIVIAPVVRTNDPKINLRINDMDAGTALKWFAQLTETHLEIVDQAVFVSDKKSKKVADAERNALIEIAAKHKVVAELPPEGAEITDQDHVKLALAIMEKEEIKVQDFPGPTIAGFDQKDAANNPFGNLGK
jgi:hypothetical protein